MQEIEDWMQSSGDHGVVLFTMGFIFNPKIVPKKLIDAFMKAFSLLPQKFLMKFDGDIDYIPANVKVLNWIPQQDVLGKSSSEKQYPQLYIALDVLCIHIWQQILEVNALTLFSSIQPIQRPKYSSRTVAYTESWRRSTMQFPWSACPFSLTKAMSSSR